MVPAGRRRRALTVAALLAALLSGSSPARAATVLAAPAASVPCPLPSPGEPPLSDGEPVFCRSNPEAESGKGAGAGDANPPDARPDGAEAKARSSGLGGDPFAALGGRSPFCERGLSGRAAANCRASDGASLAHSHPVGNYGLDIKIDTGLDAPAGVIPMLLQLLASYAWLFCLYLLKGVLLVLEWAFSLDLFGASLKDLRGALQSARRNLLGESWFMAAISAAALWGIWRAFVQRRMIESVGGLGAAFALVIVGLVLIQDPASTVGRVNELANEASLGLLSAASRGSVKSPERSFGDAMAGIFDRLVVQPWCVLQFGSVAFCERRPADVPDEIAGQAGDPRTVADLWLAFPAGGEERDAIYERWKRDGQSQAPYMASMQREATPTRLALLGLIGVGLTGAIALFGWLGLRLLGFSVLALVFMLLAPAAFLLPALGDGGRRSFIGWLKRLLGALIARAVYALILALILATAGLLGQLQSLGWIVVWALQAVFWWTVFLQRDSLIGWLSAGQGPRDPYHGSLYYKLRTAQMGVGALRRRARGAADGATGAVARGVERFRGHGEARRAGVERAAQDELRRRAAGQLGGELAGARRAVEGERELAEELRAVDRGLSKFDTDTQAAQQNPKLKRAPDVKERALLARRELLRDSQLARNDPSRLSQAQDRARRADRSMARTGNPFGDADLVAAIDQRRRDAGLGAPSGEVLARAGIDPAAYASARPQGRARIERGLADADPTWHERVLRFAGVDPVAYTAADDAGRAELDSALQRALAARHERSLAWAGIDPGEHDALDTPDRAAANERADGALAADAARLAAMPGEQGRPPRWRDQRAAREELSAKEVRERIREERRRIRAERSAERWRRRARRGVYRRR